MSLFPIWRGEILVPNSGTVKERVGGNIITHTLFEPFWTKAEIFSSEIVGHEIIRTPCRPPFDEMYIRLRGARKKSLEKLVLASTSELRLSSTTQTLEDFSLENSDIISDLNNPETLRASWAESFLFRQANMDLKIDGLRRPQIGALHAISAHFAVGHDFEEATIVLPTGTGKTETMLASLVYGQLEKLLVVVPSEALRKQITTKFEQLGILRQLGCIPTGSFNPRVACLKTGLKSKEEAQELLEKSNVIVTLPNTLEASHAEAAKLLCDGCSDLFVDEAHHISAPTWKKVKDRFRNNRVVQFTATPFRRDKKHIGGKIIFNYSLSDAQKDGYYKPIRLETVEEFGESWKRDEAIAQKAVDILRRDLDAGFEHLLMARVTNCKKADEIVEIYKRIAPEFQPIAVYSGSGRSGINHVALSSLISKKEGSSRIVVCVNMLGEGFDLPNLKVAAIHENHKSLAITLQFIGRFTRNAENVGEAAVVINTADVNAEKSLESLYAEGADWDSVIGRLSEEKIEGELRLQEVIEDLRKSGTLHEKLSLWNLHPSLSTQVYRTKCKSWFPLDYLEALPKRGEYWHALSSENNVLVVVGYQESGVKWGRYENLKESSYELLIAYWDKENKTLFMNASDYDRMKVPQVAKVITDKDTELLSGEQVFRVLNNVELPLAKNLGSSRMGAISFTSYFGPNVTEGLASIEKSESLLNNIACLGYENGEKVLWGAAQRKGKIWQQKSGSIDDWLRWCAGTLKKLEDTSGTGTNITKGFLRPSTLEQPYSEHPISIQWGEYVQNSFSDYLAIRFDTDEVPLYLVDLKVDEVEADSAVLFSLSSESNLSQYRFKIDKNVENGYMYELVSGPEVSFRLSKESFRSFEEQMLVDPLIVRYADGTFSYNKFHIPFDLAADNFASDRLESWDWSGIPLNQESMGKEEKKDTVQYRSFENIRDEFDLIFNDDGPGEAADLVALKDVSEDEIRLTLVHCKNASKGNVSGAISNLYTVCGQAQKSITVKHEGIKKLSVALRRRHERWAKSGGTRFLKGDQKLLSFFVEKSRKVHLSFEVIIVQPSVSQSSYSEDMAKLLATTELFLKRTTEAEFRFIGS